MQIVQLYAVTLGYHMKNESARKFPMRQMCPKLVHCIFHLSCALTQFMKYMPAICHRYVVNRVSS